MTFDANETSREGGAPIEIYEIRFGSDTFRYTSAEDTVTVSANDYLPIFIRRTSILGGPENRTQTIELEMQANNDFTSKYIGIQPSNKATVTISRLHRFDTPTPQVRQIFKGQVKAVAFFDNGFKAKVSLMPLSGLLARTIPLFTYQSPCNHVLYDQRCQVLEGSFKFSGTVASVSSDGLTLTVTGLDASKGVGWATGGVVKIQSTSDPRQIIAHTATDQVKIYTPFRTSVTGVTVDVFAGCDHSIATCKTKFDNVINFGGHAFVPSRNPFESGLD